MTRAESSRVGSVTRFLPCHHDHGAAHRPATAQQWPRHTAFADLG